MSTWLKWPKLITSRLIGLICDIAGTICFTIGFAILSFLTCSLLTINNFVGSPWNIEDLPRAIVIAA